MDFTSEIAKQGLGYMLFAAAVLVIYFLYKENQNLNKEKVALANQRVEDLKEARDAFGVLLATVSKNADTTLSVVQNIQQILNTSKQA